MKYLGKICRFNRCAGRSHQPELTIQLNSMPDDIRLGLKVIVVSDSEEERELHEQEPVAP